jgi:hypothetical protein
MRLGSHLASPELVGCRFKLPIDVGGNVVITARSPGIKRKLQRANAVAGPAPQR